MTDKIIIDGIDVSECKFLDTFDEIYGKEILVCECMWDSCDCENHLDCYYKQLQRLQSQYNALLKQNKSLQKELNELKGIKNVGD